MLAIRMQRTGRKGHPMYRVVVQDSRFTPSSGRVVAYIGHYNPHTKETVIDTEAAASYLQNGAQPTERVVKLLSTQKVSLPEWVKLPRTDRATSVKNAEKLRKNQPKEEVVAEEPVAEAAIDEVVEEPAV